MDRRRGAGEEKGGGQKRKILTPLKSRPLGLRIPLVLGLGWCGVVVGCGFCWGGVFFFCVVWCVVLVGGSGGGGGVCCLWGGGFSLVEWSGVGFLGGLWVLVLWVLG